eukprot:NODE_20_length_39102_cov_0.325513.p12 type:complete len:289 gc:universal NODE_20_length_39102_cov_0.325513:33985-33119(-)
MFLLFNFACYATRAFPRFPVNYDIYKLKWQPLSKTVGLQKPKLWRNVIACSMDTIYPLRIMSDFTRSFPEAPIRKAKLAFLSERDLEGKVCAFVLLENADTDAHTYFRNLRYVDSMDYYNQFLEFSIQLAKGIQQIHLHGYAHLSIDPFNIFASLEDGSLKAKIGGFQNSTSLPYQIAKVDTTQFSAPEIEANKVYNTAFADLFSFGATLLTLADPLNNDVVLFKCVKEEEQLTDYQKVHSNDPFPHNLEFIDFVNLLMHCDPFKRLRAISMFKHPFLMNKKFPLVQQ